MYSQFSDDLAEGVVNDKRLPPLPSPHAWRMAQQEALARRQAPSPIIPPLIAWNRYEMLYFMVGLLLACVGWGGGTYLIVQRLIGENSPSIDLFLLSTAACVAFIGTFFILIAIARWRGYSWGEMGFRRPSIAWVMGAVVIGVIAIPARLALLFGLMLFIDIPEVSFIEAEPNAIVEMDIWLMMALGQVLFLLVILAPLAEELLFRGVFYTALRGRFGIWVGTIGSGILFGLAHLDPLMAISNTVMGVVLAICYEQSRSLWVPMLVHLVNNGLVALCLLLAAFGMVATY